MIDTFTFTIVIAALVFNILIFLKLKDKSNGCTKECECRYPDTDIRDMLIDYELNKAKELDKALHEVEGKK
jgi:hypothetical protein